MNKNRLISYLFRLSSAILIGVFLKDLWGIYSTSTGLLPGWDARAVCSGNDAFWKGLNPYYVKNLVGTSLSYTYPPLTFELFKPLCDWPLHFRESFKYLYPLLAIFVTALLSARDWAEGHYDRGLIKTLFVLGGFAGFHWGYLTANIAVFEGAMLALALFCFCPDENQPKLGIRHFFGATILGFAFFFKMINFPVLLALYFLPFKRSEKLKLIGTGLIAYAIPLAVSIFAYHDLFSTYLMALSGKIPGQHSPATEGANPSLFFVAGHFLNIGRTLGFRVDPHYFVLQSTGYAAMILFLASIFVRRVIGLVPSPKNHLSPLEWLDQLDGYLTKNPRIAFYLTTIAILEMLISVPRVKPYAYFSLATLAAVLVAELPLWSMLTTMAFGLVFPLFHWSSRIFGGFEQLVGVLVVWGGALNWLGNAPQVSSESGLLNTPSPISGKPQPDSQQNRNCCS